jgi:hypothetical protein
VGEKPASERDAEASGLTEALAVFTRSDVAGVDVMLPVLLLVGAGVAALGGGLVLGWRRGGAPGVAPGPLLTRVGRRRS